MKLSVLGRYVLSSVAVALIAGCGGNTGSGAVPITDAQPQALKHHKTFRYTGKKQFFKVPAGVTKLHVIALGGAGAAGAGALVGYGGRVSALIPVVPGERIAVYVGGNGDRNLGGYNGGGQGYASCCSYPRSRKFAPTHRRGYGGGGATDIREGGNSLQDRILVAGGGGGQGGLDYTSDGGGGKGGGSTAGSGAAGFFTSSYSGIAGGGGSGGSQEVGGSGGSGGSGSYGSGETGGDGSLAQGGDGGGGRGYGSYTGGGGGGAGGGYYGGGGGGGGGGDDYGGDVGGGGGGGGGSSYIEPSALKFQSWRGWKSPAYGLVVFSW